MPATKKVLYGVFEKADTLRLADVCGSGLFRTEKAAEEWAAQLKGWHPEVEYVVSATYSTFGVSVSRTLEVKLTVPCPCGTSDDNPACPHHGKVEALAS